MLTVFLDCSLFNAILFVISMLQLYRSVTTNRVAWYRKVHLSTKTFVKESRFALKKSGIQLVKPFKNLIKTLLNFRRPKVFASIN